MMDGFSRAAKPQGVAERWTARWITTARKVKAYDDGAPAVNYSVFSSQYTAPGQVNISLNVAGNTEDGWVLESGETTNVGGSNNNNDSTATALKIGDDTSKKQYKAILSFDTSSIPDNASIVWAQLKLMRGGVTGTSPFSWTASPTLNVDVGTFGANAIENGDFQAAAAATNVVTGGMSNPASNGTWSTGVFNSNGKSAINKTGRTHLRVYFSADDNNNTANDFMGFYSQNNATQGNRPILTVTYQPAY